ncbi:MAG: hypothetical protein D6746_06625 [Bacteroidetes bacterium]|nr:MAG: hypothetical protein D6746_06625 [Bacteroidota bacterium]
MTRRRLVRFQVTLLFIVTGLLIARVVIGPPVPEGLVVLTDLEPGQLRQATFTLEARTPLLVEATGSFVNLESSSPLAAYGWILRRDTREVVWQMTPNDVRHGNGTLALARDSLSLPAGTYDVFFTTYGPTPGAWRRDASWLSLRHHWTGDAEQWRLIVVGEGRAPTDQPATLAALAPDGANVVWSSAPASHGPFTHTFLFQVTRTLPLTLYAVGELCDPSPCDHGYLEEAATGRRVWAMTPENTRPAGGWEAQRVFRGTVTLPPGLYRAVYVTDERHHAGAWQANPPLDPAAWGLTLSTDTPEALRPFDPWTDRTPLISLTRVPDDALRSAQFALTQPARLIVYALGEISSGGSRYDYGWIENNETGERVWEMTREGSQPTDDEASGNRVEIAFLSLSPGTYTLAYQTDGSHAYGDWRKAEPPHPERWGVTLFPMADPLPDSVFVRLETEPPTGLATPAPPPPPGTGRLLLRRTRLGNDTRVEFPFALSHPATLHIVATGEISTGGTYDYGWIERADNGEVVWKMTLQNTVPAGGDDRNRRFDGLVALPPGEYIAYFTTDFSHAWGDFDDGAPDDPDAWGIVIELLE